MAKLFEPLKLRELELSNRIVIPAMCQYSADNGNATDWHLIHLGSLALSGASLLILEATAVAQQGKITHGCLGLWSDENEAALGTVLKSVRRHSDIKLGIQLSHSGRKGSAASPFNGRGALTADEGAWQTVGPSEKSFAEGWPPPKMMDRVDMLQLVEDYVMATKRADRLGIDLIELHAAHGYLLSQFLSPLANIRTDEYGGSLDNRMRYPLEVFRAVREAWPNHKPLGVRVNGTDWDPAGLGPDEAVAFSAALKAEGCDYIDVSSGGNVVTKVSTGPGYQVPFATKIKQETGICTMAVGMIKHPYQAEQIVVSELADLVAVGRAMLNNPHWAWWAAETLRVPINVNPQYARAATSDGLPPPSWTPTS